MMNAERCRQTAPDEPTDRLSLRHSGLPVKGEKMVFHRVRKIQTTGMDSMRFDAERLAGVRWCPG